MPVGSTTAKNTMLDATYGDNAAFGAGVPSNYFMAFFNGDPTAGGTELTSAGGYSRTQVANSSAIWSAATGGQKKNAVALLSSTSTGSFSAQITHVGFMDSATLGAGNLWDSGPLDTPLTVNAANTTVRFQANALTVTVT